MRVNLHLTVCGHIVPNARIFEDPVILLKPGANTSCEFSVDHYYEQLAAGYSKSLPSKGLVVYMADKRDLKGFSQANQKVLQRGDGGDTHQSVQSGAK